MKQRIAFIITVIVLLGLTSCGDNAYDDAYGEGYDAGYDDGYDFGYETAMNDWYFEGIDSCQGQISNMACDDLYDLDDHVYEMYGVSPDEAMQILENYADGEYFTDGEIERAIVTLFKGEVWIIF